MIDFKQLPFSPDQISLFLLEGLSLQRKWMIGFLLHSKKVGKSYKLLLAIVSFHQLKNFDHTQVNLLYSFFCSSVASDNNDVVNSIINWFY